MTEWRSIETAPKGGGAKFLSDPNWVNAPRILLLCADGNMVVGYWDWYYAEDGSGYELGILAWVEPCSGIRIQQHYGAPTHWMPLPESPHSQKRTPG